MTIASQTLTKREGVSRSVGHRQLYTELEVLGALPANAAGKFDFGELHGRELVDADLTLSEDRVRHLDRRPSSPTP